MHPEDRLDTPEPFTVRGYMSSHSLRHLLAWLEANAEEDTPIAKSYTTGKLMDDLGDILDGMWSDSIDAMGEDA